MRGVFCVFHVCCNNLMVDTQLIFMNISLCLLKCMFSKETISKVKRQPSEWEKIIANEAMDKELISKIYKQLMQLNTRNINDPNQKMDQRTKQTFIQRRHTDG